MIRIHTSRAGNNAISPPIFYLFLHKLPAAEYILHGIYDFFKHQYFGFELDSLVKKTSRCFAWVQIHPGFGMCLDSQRCNFDKARDPSVILIDIRIQIILLKLMDPDES